VIVRLMEDGQYRVDDGLAAQLNEIDDAAVQALEAGDQSGLQARLSELHRLVRERGERLDDSHLGPSDAVVPPPDLSLDEARKLFADDGLIPDLPA
jgi:hypothetical protein